MALPGLPGHRAGGGGRPGHRGGGAEGGSGRPAPLGEHRGAGDLRRGEHPALRPPGGGERGAAQEPHRL
ncbi:hypothetical protein B5E80_09895 [Flavonifractor sp. An135]|nr:hypothetical protein B5E80_09895 [Flavonifractor sp. An135]